MTKCFFFFIIKAQKQHLSLKAELKTFGYPVLCDIRSVQTEEKREKVKRENVKRNNSSWNFQKQPVWTTSVLQQKCPYCQLWKLVHWLEIHSNSQYELKFNFTLSTINLFSGVKLDLGGEVWLKNKKIIALSFLLPQHCSDTLFWSHLTRFPWYWSFISGPSTSWFIS